MIEWCHTYQKQNNNNKKKQRLHSEPQHLSVSRRRLHSVLHDLEVFWQFWRMCQRIARRNGMVSYTQYQQADTEDSSKCHSFTTAVWQTDAGWQCVRLYSQLSKNGPQGGRWPSDPFFPGQFLDNCGLTVKYMAHKKYHTAAFEHVKLTQVHCNILLAMTNVILLSLHTICSLLYLVLI